ncbi:hypothetical protein G6F47_011113 [Rhizopus delemar]|nr:hypothetical protein G6F54_008398 [Rhizopus delemar]KAG1499598.1 hypothetical protein G6F53_011485 [Rhizopus delemar]KAG1586810.1 hypothetical protein G6F47_011113 [Rhizopus delemar]
MPPSSPINRKLSSAPASSTTTINNTIPMTNNTNRTPLLYSTAIRGCEPCKRRKRVCNGQKPCMPCAEGSQECVYSVVSEHPRSVFSTNAARRLSSGSACETCRRRKTKCDGGNPCGFCASSGIDCINNNNSLERKKRTASNENEAMDRIEDRLRRIERLMTAFTPSPLSKNCTTSNYYRKMSSPLLSAQKQQRPYRHHSIQGISSSEPTSRDSYSMTTSSTSNSSINNNNNSSNSSNNSNSSSSNNSNGNSNNSNSSAAAAPPPPLPPLSPRTLRQSSSQLTNQSMYLSPSSSSSTTSTVHSPNMQPSTSTPTSTNDSWNQPTPIPSLMDQLSKLTFVTTAMDYNLVQYPIYPISTPSPPPSSQP